MLASATTAPTVNLGYAQYQGAADIVTNTTSFLGIRYAATPVGTRSVVIVRAFHRGLILRPGNLQWAAPQPPYTLSGVQNATTQPNECYQRQGATNGNSPTRYHIQAYRECVGRLSVPQVCVQLQRSFARFMTNHDSVYTPGQIVTPVKSGGLPVLVWIHGGG